MKWTKAQIPLLLTVLTLIACASDPWLIRGALTDYQAGRYGIAIGGFEDVLEHPELKASGLQRGLAHLYLGEALIASHLKEISKQEENQKPRSDPGDKTVARRNLPPELLEQAWSHFRQASILLQQAGSPQADADSELDLQIQGWEKSARDQASDMQRRLRECEAANPLVNSTSG